MMHHNTATLIASGAGEFAYATPVAPSSLYDFLWYAWDEAQDEAERAYTAWCRSGDRGEYVVYRAAQDRADVAQDALATCHAGVSG
jgi:hypothetical protein